MQKHTVEKSGIGLRSAHQAEILETKPELGFLEVHSENYFTQKGRGFELLEEAGRHYPISLHGVALSLASDDGLDMTHLQHTKRLMDRLKPDLVSEHLAWNRVDGVYLNDLIPVPYTQETLQVMAAHVNQAQDLWGRQILIENPSVYMEFKASTMPETEFLNRLCVMTGCGLILDVNNVYVSSVNNAFDPKEFIDQVEKKYVGEIHLAGHLRKEIEGQPFLIDTHNDFICAAVWDLYRYTIAQTGRVPTLIEWDSELPSLAELVGEAHKADLICDEAENQTGGIYGSVA